MKPTCKLIISAMYGSSLSISYPYVCINFCKIFRSYIYAKQFRTKYHCCFSIYISTTTTYDAFLLVLLPCNILIHEVVRTMRKFVSAHGGTQIVPCLYLYICSLAYIRSHKDVLIYWRRVCVEELR